MAGVRATLNDDLQLHVLLFADLESLCSARATDKTLCRLGRVTLGDIQWIDRGSNRDDMRRMLWRYVDGHPRQYRPKIAARHNGPVWSVALSPRFLVSAADGESSPVLQVADASCSRKTNDASYRKTRRPSDGLEINGVLIARTVKSWHLALRGDQLVVLGRLIDLSRLHENETMSLWAANGLLCNHIPIRCPLSSSLVTWGPNGRLYLTQRHTVRLAAHPVTEAPATEDEPAMVRLENGSLDPSLFLPMNGHVVTAIAAGSGPDGRDFLALTTQAPNAAVTPWTPVLVWLRPATGVASSHEDPDDFSSVHPSRSPLRMPVPHGKPVYGLATSAGRLASGSDDGTIKLWNPYTVPTRRLLATIETGSRIWALAMSGELLVSGGEGNSVANINVWSLRDVPTFSAMRASLVRAGRGQPVRLASLRGEYDPVRSLAFDGDRIVSGHDNGIVHVWHHGGLPIAAQTNAESA